MFYFFSFFLPSFLRFLFFSLSSFPLLQPQSQSNEWIIPIPQLIPQVYGSFQGLFDLVLKQNLLLRLLLSYYHSYFIMITIIGCCNGPAMHLINSPLQVQETNFFVELRFTFSILSNYSIYWALPVSPQTQATGSQERKPSSKKCHLSTPCQLWHCMTHLECDGSPLLFFVSGKSRRMRHTPPRTHMPRSRSVSAPATRRGQEIFPLHESSWAPCGASPEGEKLPLSANGLKEHFLPAFGCALSI